MHGELRKRPLDLARMTDETLVILAQDCAYHPATDELVLRHYEQMSKFIAWMAKRSRLRADVQDAQQNSVFAILEAISAYDTLESLKPFGCSFRSYMRTVVAARFRDFVKHLRRVERRYSRLEEMRSISGDGKEQRPAGRMSDPVELLAQKEEAARLRRALDRLDETMRKLWQELSDGKKLPQIAREQGVSYDRMKRRRQRLLAQLAALLRQEREPSEPRR